MAAGEDSVPDFTTRVKELVSTIIDNLDNSFIGDVIGRKDDTAATAVNNTNTLMRYAKAIYTAVVGAAGLEVKQSQVTNVQLNDRIMFFIGLTQRGIGKITAANINITAATCKIYRSTGGGAYIFVADIPLSKSDGKVYFDYSFTAAGGWSLDDSWYIENDGIVCTMSPSGTANVGLLNWMGDITEEPDIKSQVDAIRNTDFPNVEGTGFVKDTDSLVNLTHKATWTDARAVKVDNLDATISSRATQTSVDDIPATGNVKDFNATQKGYLAGLIGGLSAVRKTTYTIVTGVATAYPNDGTWVTIKNVTVAKDTLLRGIIITNSGGSPTNPVYRITYNGTADLNKVYPYGASTAVESGIFREIRDNLTVTEPDTYYIQVACDIGGAGGASAVLTELDIIELG